VPYWSNMQIFTSCLIVSKLIDASLVGID
jgi:hypothetical protein